MKSAKQVDVFYKIQLLAQFGHDAADTEGVSSTLQLLAQCNTANCPLESAAVQIEMDAVIFLGPILTAQTTRPLRGLNS